MNFILTCESCEERFNEEDRQPVILPDCGHTFCEQCVSKVLSLETPCCANEQCRKPITKFESHLFIKNHKILSLISNTTMNKSA